MVQNVFLSSTAARIRAYYEALPEASMAVPVVNPVWASRPTRFGSPALRGALRFALTTGGSGLSERDQTSYAATLCLAEREMAGGTGAVGGQRRGRHEGAARFAGLGLVPRRVAGRATPAWRRRAGDGGVAAR